jgi:nucleoid-associated protein YgaU
VARTYVVRPGDTLTRIAERELGAKERWREIAAANPGLEVARPLSVGQELRMEEAR